MEISSSDDNNKWDEFGVSDWGLNVKNMKWFVHIDCNIDLLINHNFICL